MSLFEDQEWEDMSFEERLAIKVEAESSFLGFTQIFFELLQGDPLMVNWHHRYMANEIDHVVRGDNSTQSLAIAIPPGGTKSEFFSIHVHAYTLALIRAGVIKRFRNLSLSSGKSLVERNSKRVRDIISSKEFKELWPCEFSTSQAEEWIVNNEKGRAIGTMVSKPMGGQIIGSRGGYPGSGYSGAIYLDDPDKAEDMFSSIKRERSHRLLTNTVRSRRGDKSKENSTPIIIIQQMLHKEDSINYCLGGGMGIDFKPIKIPALITKDYLQTLPLDVAASCWESIKDSPSRIRGGVEYWSYWPEMEDIDQLMDLWDRDEYTFMSQYMQAPIALSGNLVDTDWFPRYMQLPPLCGMAVYVDTNSGKVTQRNDYTVFTLCGETTGGDLYVLEVKRGKWDPEELLTEANDLWSRWNGLIPKGSPFKIRYMSVEDKQAGQGLIQTLKKKGKIPIHAMPRGTDQNKYARHCNVMPFMKQNKVYIPSTYDGNGDTITHTTWHTGAEAFNVDWVVPFLSELEGVTIGVLMDQESGYDDQYDTLMDAIQDMQINGQSSLASALSARRARKRSR